MKKSLKIILILVAFIVTFLLGRASREDKASPSTSSLIVETQEPNVSDSPIETTEIEEEDESEEVETISTPEPSKEKKDNAIVNKKKAKQADVPTKLPIVKVSDNGTVTLKNGNLQLWKKGKMLCSSQIPRAFKPCDEYNGYYVDKNNRLVILQTYKKNGKFKIYYTILANNVKKVLYNVWTDNPFEDDKSYIFQDTQGKYRIVDFVNRDALRYADFGFSNSTIMQEGIQYVKAKSKGTPLITEERISETRFTSWGGSCSGESKQTVDIWEICFTIKKHGTFFCTIYEPLEEVKIDNKLYERLTKSFPVDQYEDKLSELIQITKNIENK